MFAAPDLLSRFLWSSCAVQKSGMVGMVSGRVSGRPWASEVELRKVVGAGERWSVCSIVAVICHSVWLEGSPASSILLSTPQEVAIFPAKACDLFSRSGSAFCLNTNAVRANEVQQLGPSCLRCYIPRLCGCIVVHSRGQPVTPWRLVVDSPPTPESSGRW